MTTIQETLQASNICEPRSVDYWAMIDEEKGFDVLFRLESNFYQFFADRYFSANRPMREDISGPERVTNRRDIDGFMGEVKRSLPRSIEWKDENALKDIALQIVAQFKTVKTQ